MSTNDRTLHCWKGKREYVEETKGWGSPEYWDTYSDEGDNRDGTCMLEAGHGGEHDFTPDDKIGVTFAPAKEWVS